MSKKELLLSHVIMEYLQHREPIGSESLRVLLDTKISSATIRNYFKALAHEGLLFQPHISSGRIPTESALKMYWTHEIKTRNPFILKSMESVQEACFEYDIFCALSFEKDNRLLEVKCVHTGLDAGSESGRKLMIVFENIGIVLPFSSTLERFLLELKGLELRDVRKIAYQVRALDLLNALQLVQDRELQRFHVGSLTQAYHHNRDDSGLYALLDGSMFDRLENGIYYEEVAPKGYMIIAQDIEIAEKKARMLCVGALDRNYTQFYKSIQS